MEAIVKINRISATMYNNVVYYTFELDQAIPAYVRNVVDGDAVYTKATSNRLVMPASRAVAMIIAAVPFIGIIHTHLVEVNLLRTGVRIGIDAARLTAYLANAKVTLNQTEFHAGDEYTDADGVVGQHKYDGFNTEFTAIELSETGSKLIDKAVEACIAII